jgi:predicted Zn-dependent peptidase
MVSYFQPLFEPLKGKQANLERSAPKSRAGVSVHFKDLEQVHICLGGEAPSLKDPRRYGCAILNTILGGNMSSRLFQEIRENRGLAYSVYSFVSSYVDTGLLGVYVATDARNVNPALETIQSEIRKISKGELSRSDLEEARDHLIGGIYLASESAENRMMRIAKNEFLFNRYVGFEELVSHLERVTVDEVVEVAGDIFAKDGVSLVTLGPLREEDLDKSTLEFT